MTMMMMIMSSTIQITNSTHVCMYFVVRSVGDISVDCANSTVMEKVVANSQQNRNHRITVNWSM